RSETMLHFLAQNNIYVSSGSACAKGKPSHVLSAMGLSSKTADSAIRISFCKENTKEDIDALIDALKLGINTLVKRK
ncbi:MAG: aminotransferase class V-fold PLP-dependent enzyme, partial [Ruminococcus sp.]|nr:aminotransferase class V-fold PLP-dependent enzyme [Ruminococcus sp.]